MAYEAYITVYKPIPCLKVAPNNKNHEPRQQCVVNKCVCRLKGIHGFKSFLIYWSLSQATATVQDLAKVKCKCVHSDWPLSLWYLLSVSYQLVMAWAAFCVAAE